MTIKTVAAQECGASAAQGAIRYISGGARSNLVPSLSCVRYRFDLSQ